jgi:ribosome-binding protein aMBF1 (putative translation factor)
MSRRPHRTELGNHFSEGARLLWLAVAARDGSQTVLAHEIHVGVAVLNRWLYGERKPSRQFAAIIEARLGIPASAWDAKVRGRFVLPAVAAKMAA